MKGYTNPILLYLSHFYMTDSVADESLWEQLKQWSGVREGTYVGFMNTTGDNMERPGIASNQI
jgi:hypothetical protein